MKYNNIITAVMIGMTAVEAAPSAPAIQVAKREQNPQYSAFALCIRKSVPNYPRQGKPTVKQVKDCMASTKGQTKRAEPAEGPVLIWEPEEELSKREEDALIWEPEEGPLQSRAIVDTILTLGKDLVLDNKGFCRGKEVHDDFLFVKEIQEKTVTTCNQLKEQIEATGLSQDGGVGFVVDTVTNGHDKQGHQLKDKRGMTVSYILSFYPPANMAINEIKTLASAVHDLCNDAILRLGSKNEEGGCTQNIKYFRPSKAKTYNDPAQIGGSLSMVWNKMTVGDFSIDFSNDS